MKIQRKIPKIHTDKYSKDSPHYKAAPEKEKPATEDSNAKKYISGDYKSKGTSNLYKAWSNIDADDYPTTAKLLGLFYDNYCHCPEEYAEIAYNKTVRIVDMIDDERYNDVADCCKWFLNIVRVHY